MAKFETVKRATVGNLVKGDATGFDEWIVGRITASDTKKGTITFAPADGSEEVTMKRSEMYKATQAEYEAQKKQPSLNMGEILETAANVALGRPTGNTIERATEEVELTEAMIVADDDEEEKEDPLARMKKYASKYETVLASSGKKSKDSGDRVAVELRGLTLEAVYEAVAAGIDVSAEELVAKYCHLNDGQARMCLGNRLRGHYRRQEAAEEEK